MYYSLMGAFVSIDLIDAGVLYELTKTPQSVLLYEVLKIGSSVYGSEI